MGPGVGLAGPGSGCPLVAQVPALGAPCAGGRSGPGLVCSGRWAWPAGAVVGRALALLHRGCVMSGRVMVCGSRSLLQSGPGAQLVQALVWSLLGAGRSLVVGCAAGADAAALNAAVSAGAAGRVSVLAAFGPGGQGAAGSASAVSVVAAAQAVGASVSWWAGGGQGVPLRARLVGRSLAAVRSATGSGPGAGLVAVVGGPPPRRWSGSGPWWSCGSGSWSSVAAAAALGLPVVVVPASASVLCSAAELPGLPCGPGCWVPAGGGVWARAWRWAPQQGLF